MNLSNLVTFQEIEMGLCMMEIMEYIYIYIFLENYEWIEYSLEKEDTIEFMILSEFETEEGITRYKDVLFSYEFSKNMGVTGNNIASYLPGRAIEEVELRLIELSKSLKTRMFFKRNTF